MANAQLNTITLDGKQAIYPIRNELAEFAIKMERFLQNNDDKSGWEELNIDKLFRRIKREFDEFHGAYSNYVYSGDDKHLSNMRNVVIYIANYCMFFYHNTKNKGQKGGGCTTTEPNLGCATTSELLDEITTRIKIDGRLGYRTIDED